MTLENLSDEQRAKLQACETAEDILALAKEEGYELSEAELAAVSGGGTGWTGPRRDHIPRGGV